MTVWHSDDPGDLAKNLWRSDDCWFLCETHEYEREELGLSQFVLFPPVGSYLDPRNIDATSFKEAVVLAEQEMVNPSWMDEITSFLESQSTTQED